MNDYIITYVYCPIVEYTVGNVVFCEQVWEHDWDEFHGTREEVNARVAEMWDSGMYDDIHVSMLYGR